MSVSLNSLKGVYIGIFLGTTIGPIKGDTRSLDNGPDSQTRLALQQTPSVLEIRVWGPETLNSKVPKP